MEEDFDSDMSASTSGQLDQTRQVLRNLNPRGARTVKDELKKNPEMNSKQLEFPTFVLLAFFF